MFKAIEYLYLVIMKGEGISDPNHNEEISAVAGRNFPFAKYFNQFVLIILRNSKSKQQKISPKSEVNPILFRNICSIIPVAICVGLTSACQKLLMPIN